MTPASWVPEKGRLASEEKDGCARELNRGRCADMWVSPQKYLIKQLTLNEKDGHT